MIKVLERNENIHIDTSELIEREMNGYTADTMMRLWRYAKIGGYKEYVVKDIHNVKM